MTKSPIATAVNLNLAETHLSKSDANLARLIKQYGPCDLKPHTDYYQDLVESIIGQQLSVKAAHAIRLKFIALFGNNFPGPEDILAAEPERLRSAGLSGSKVNYVKNLAEKISNGELELDKVSLLSNEDLTTELTKVKGIGVWTSHMFLMFCVGRLDILPVGDLGIKKGIQLLYGLKSLPSEEQVAKLAKKYHWQPYASVASWYIWRSLDNKPKE